MALNLNTRTVILEFGEDTILAGREVTVSLNMPLRDYFAILRGVTTIQAADDHITADTLDLMQEIYGIFAERALVDWDIEDSVSGKLPPDRDGMNALPPDAANAIIAAWASHVGGTPPNSDAGSVNGVTPDPVLSGVTGQS